MSLHKKIFLLYHSRLFQELKYFLPFVFLFILLFNLFIFQTIFEKNKITVMDDPGNSFAHEILGDDLLTANQLDQAETEYRLSNSQKLQHVADIKALPDKLKTEIVAWQKIVASFPNYRDGNLKLAILNYQLKRLFDAKKFLTISLEIDPNNGVAKQLLLSFPQPR